MERDSVREYAAGLRHVGTRGLPRGFVVAGLRRVTTHEMREGAKLRSTQLIRPWSKRRAASIAMTQTPLLLHLGSGTHHLDGWVNLDVLGMSADVYWDLRDGVPFPNNCADGIFCEHVLEHFTLADGLPLLDEYIRVLKPGGLCRLGVPDFGVYLRSYAGDRTQIEALRPGRPTPMLALAEVVLAHGHRSAWDGETLALVMRDAGLVNVTVNRWGATRLERSPDSESRRAESVYAEGYKVRKV